MPYSAAHKAETRARIIESARIMFNRHGFEQVSIDDIMREAGLTRGGFYNHFASKQELFAAAVHSFTSCNPFRLRVEASPKSRTPRQLARLLIDMYLSDENLADVDQQCPMIAVPSDVARAGLKPRAAYTTLVANMKTVFEQALADGKSKVDKRAEASALLIVNLCVGGMVIARTTDDPHLRKALRAVAKREAYRLLDPP
jgi:AcrR family transcriptional regulator